jgi:hypothetical protein
MAESESEIWAAYDAARDDLMVRLSKRLRSPEHPGMVYVEFRAMLSRLQKETAEKLGKSRDDLMDRFGPEEAVVKEKCGV